MAKPYTQINKTDFRNLYNIDEILIRKDEIMEFLKTYKDDGSQAIAFATRKKHHQSVEDDVRELGKRMDSMENNIKELHVTLKDVVLAIREIKNELKVINNRLDNIVKLNNLKE